MTTRSQVAWKALRVSFLISRMPIPLGAYSMPTRLCGGPTGGEAVSCERGSPVCTHHTTRQEPDLACLVQPCDCLKSDSPEFRSPSVSWMTNSLTRGLELLSLLHLYTPHDTSGGLN
jgi:hypothetical protein